MVEWALLELQGILEIQPSAQHLPLNAFSIGSLCRSQQEKYYFTSGYHELEGKKVSLKKPMLKTSELKAIGIIRHKILFKTRPKALISKSESKTKELK
ncbi:hypothetical protein KP509_37G047700 [Ceratopteris richardii]|uniref:Uncharacterized protein n=1 Tax=Ceratopteris richardii TaxID=49495 RepID=A0A8T2Q7I0_CERRI|nr:hypothetical protein KP509_37G047700 [Ceratopteris richardii]